MPIRFQVYNGLLSVTLLAVLIARPIWDSPLAVGPLWALVVLVGLFFLTERADLNFYDARTRFGLSTSEAILFPMMVVASFTGLVWGVTIAMTIERISRRVGLAKSLFNIASFGCATSVTGAIWAGLNDGSGTFSVRNAAVGVLALACFAILTHVFTAFAIAFAEGGHVMAITRSLAPATLTSFFGSIVVGLLFAASFTSAVWTVALFPAVIAALYFGFRAVLSQARERERLEALHAATRALAAGPGIGEAISGFLKAVTEIASSGRALVVLSSSIHLKMTDPWMYSEVRGDVDVAIVEPVSHGPLIDLATRLDDQDRLLVTAHSDGLGELRQGLGSTEFLAVPVKIGEQSVGVLAVFDRVGADEFDDDDVTLLQALSNELSVSLDSYRLFHEVEEERERFGRIFMGSKEGICLLDGDGVVKAWNPALERITGYMSETVMDRVWSDVVTVRDRQQDRIRGDELVGVEADEEIELVTRAGPSRWVSVLAGPVGEAEDGGWVVLVRDVTAEHEVEGAKSDFLSTISHELRTPLTTIKGSLQVLGRGRDNLPEELADQMIGVTTRGAERLERLVMNLLAVSQIESGTMPIFPDEVSLGDLIREKIDVMLKDHDRVVVVVSEGSLVVRADRERVGHAIEHLIENAVKFGGSQGEIRITVERDNGYGRFSISDEGPGVPPADRERIFERFVRLGDVLTRETQGAGVGLFIAARSVEAMGGRIWVESEGGQGSTFHLTVPLAKPMAVEDAAHTA